MNEMVKNAIVMYTVRRVNPKLNGVLSRLLYALLIPISLVNGLCYENIFPQKYRRFIMSMLYPECDNKNIPQFTENCQIYHKDNLECTKAFNENVHTTFLRLFKVYYKFYGIQTLISFAMSKHKSLDVLIKLAKVYVSNIVSSTMFLGCHISLCRFLMCKMQGSGKLSKLKLMLASTLSTIPSFIERGSRIHQINNMFLSYLVIGNTKNPKTNSMNNLIPVMAFIFNLLRDKGKINVKQFIISTGCAILM